MVQQIVKETKIVKELIFIATTKKLPQNICVYQDLCDNIRLNRIIIVSRGTDVVVIPCLPTLDALVLHLRRALTFFS